MSDSAGNAPTDSWDAIKQYIVDNEDLSKKILSSLKRLSGAEKFVKRITTDCGDCYDICIEEPSDGSAPQLVLKKVERDDHCHPQHHHPHHHHRPHHAQYYQQARYYPQPGACPPNPWMSAGLMGTWLGMNSWFASPNCMPVGHCAPPSYQHSSYGHCNCERCCGSYC